MTPWVTPSDGDQSASIAAGFNSATAVTPWVTATTGDARRRQGSLQFGHGGDAVGDRAVISGYHSSSSRQFGHGGDAVGDSSSGCPTGPSKWPCFNSATAVTPWVTDAALVKTWAEAKLQFGHGGDAVGDHVVRAVGHLHHKASIRPRR